MKKIFLFIALFMTVFMADAQENVTKLYEDGLTAVRNREYAVGAELFERVIIEGGDSDNEKISHCVYAAKRYISKAYLNMGADCYNNKEYQSAKEYLSVAWALADLYNDILTKLQAEDYLHGERIDLSEIKTISKPRVFDAVASKQKKTEAPEVKKVPRPDKIAVNNAIIWGCTERLTPVYYIADLSFDDLEYAVAMKSTPLAYKFGELVVSGKSDYEVLLEYDSYHKEYLVGYIGLDEQDAKKIYGYDSRHKDTYHRNVYKYEQNGKVAAYNEIGNYIRGYSAKFDEQGRIVRLDWSQESLWGGTNTCYVVVTYDSANCINMLNYHIRNEYKGKVSTGQTKYTKTGANTWSYIETLSSGDTYKHTFEIQERDEKGRWTKGVIKYPDVDTHSVGVVQYQVVRTIDPNRGFFDEIKYFDDYDVSARALKSRYDAK